MRRAVALGLAVVLGAACGGSRGGAAPAAREVPLVADEAGAFASITVTAGPRTAEVPASLRGPLAPLLTARTLPRPHPLAEYGLDPPRARLVYRRSNGATVEVLLGDPAFDRRLVYARRPADAAVRLVLRSAVAPVLGLVGVEIPPPAD